MFDKRELTGKTIVITGASRGIGEQTAMLASHMGANVVIGARSEAELRRVKEGMEDRTLACPVDVTDKLSVQDFIERSIEAFGKIDAIVNSAGVGVFQSVLDLSAEDFDRMINVNLKGTFLMCKYGAKQMLPRRRGKIINLISVAGTTALPGCGGYSASKFGALGLTKVLQAELRSQGIQVTAILPGAVASPFWADMESVPDFSKMIPVESLARHIGYVLCMPEDSAIDEWTIMPPLGIL